MSPQVLDMRFKVNDFDWRSEWNCLDCQWSVKVDQITKYPNTISCYTQIASVFRMSSSTSIPMECGRYSSELGKRIIFTWFVFALEKNSDVQIGRLHFTASPDDYSTLIPLVQFTCAIDEFSAVFLLWWQRRRPYDICRLSVCLYSHLWWTYAAANWTKIKILFKAFLWRTGLDSQNRPTNWRM